jgi:hypothetical protein
MGAALIALALLSLDNYAANKTNKLNNNIIISDDYKSTFNKAQVHNFIVILLGCTFIILGFIGSRPVEEPYLTVGFYFTCFYFIFLEIIIFSNINIKIFTKKKFK